MIEHSTTHTTFTLERLYPVPVARVFAAWADPKVKAHWFAPDGEHELDFRVGGREVNRHLRDDGPPLMVESWYRDIVQDERIVYTSALYAGDDLATVSLTTIELCPGDDGGTRLVLTEQDTFLDGREDPSWREQGTGSWLDALGAELRETDAPRP
ncbi:SRPBCC family protein [Actinomadura adrarensis]|uniref:SRPBCC family protein n=1 Tax=Actinomadura adrarensis TaxID=1819600 RepID=A0ABW3CL46_9ACTN